MKARLFAETEGDMAVEISTMHVLDTVWDDVAPGGPDEVMGLTKYIRDPDIARTAEEALTMLR
eukprot:3114148-Prorocentrum_lima.AAC.1